MANLGTLPVTLVTILLLVAPGYLAIRVFLRAAERNDTLDRTGKIVWSSAVSLASLLLLYVTSPHHFQPLTDVGQTLTQRFNIVSGSSLVDSSLSTGVLLYLLHVVFLLIGSLVVGRADRSRRDDPYEERAPWYYALTDLGEERIGVLLQDGSRIDGQFVPAAWDSSTKDLVLESPEKSVDGTRVPLGRSILISSDNISAVVFSEDDPNSETEAEVDVSESATEQIEQMPQVDDDPPEETDSEESDERAGNKSPD